ncbi:MAG: iron-sulfur cluster assembly scaffold protein [Dinoroseobacter sp.]|nr:iron-sulfur cluster assembly scaffold protein [Dinoroseobacter sp.]NQZ74145.1 iron-sulfur cluster assembly scaffold protein [Dinoroseobacter sp.]
MSSKTGHEPDLLKLYSNRILALASDLPHVGRLANPHASSKRRAPLCGSMVTIDIAMENGVITEYAQDVKACALGQASAAILGENIIGCSIVQVRTARDQMAAMLRENGPVPEAPFEGFEVLVPARDFANRHASILLAVEATLDAMSQLQHADCA